MGVFDKDHTPLEGAELQKHIDTALAVEPPSGPSSDRSYRLLKLFFSPTVIGIDNIPGRPCLFVGNHAIFGLDAAMLMPIMLQEYGRFLRRISDKAMFAVPGFRDRIVRDGGVIGHPEVCSAMMEAGHDLVVYPGGAREALKRSAQIYTLQWGERTGFVNLAASHGYTIVPFAMVGPDECYAHLMEGEDLPDSVLGKLLSRAGLLSKNIRTDMLPPIPLGALGTLLPKPQPCFLQFGSPIDLTDLEGKRLTKKQQQSIRDDTAGQIEDMVRELLVLRAQQQGEMSFIRRLLTM